ncbi:MAG: hypothetical protein QNJ94_15635 [Alphaproteobacteria bacterium]|nr:hypothetical protein [Alphaproteobacteria bacterium]
MPKSDQPRHLTICSATGVLLALGLLAACAESTSSWVKPGASDEEFRAGVYLCTQRARAIIHQSERATITRTDQDAYARCLRQSGYEKVTRQ